MECRLFHQMNDYKNVTDNFIQNIFKCGMLLDEHVEALQQCWEPSSDEPNGILRSLRFMPKSVKLSTLVLQCLTGDKSTLVPLGIIIPASLHYLISKLKKMKESKYIEAFEKLTLMLHKLYELIRTVDRYHHSRLISVDNLNRHVTRQLFRVTVSKMNTFLYANGKDIIDVASKINDLIKKIDIALGTDEFRNFYEVAFEQIDFSLPNLPTDDAYKAYYERCRLSYSLIVSSFLCAIGFGFCCPHVDYVDINYKKLLDEILPEALEFVCTSFKKMSEDFKCVYGKLPETPSESHSQEVVEKFGPINKTLIGFIRKIRLIFDVAQIMHDDLQQQTEHANIGEILELHYDDIEKLFSDCQDMLNCLKRNVCRRVKIEYAETAHRRQQMAQSEAAAVVGELNISESAGPSVIRHDDPDIPANTEEYNLSVHGSDDENEKEEPSTLEYAELLDYVRKQKLIIQELNTELMKRKFITQGEESSSHKIPTARILPIKQPANQRRNARAAAPNNTGQLIGANLNGPLLGFVPQQNDPLAPFGTTFQQAFPQPNFPEHVTLPFPPHSLPQHIVLLNHANAPPATPVQPIQPPPPPPMPNIFNNFNPEEPIPYEYQNLAAQIHAAVNNGNWGGGNEDIYQNDPIDVFYQNEHNFQNEHNLDNLYNNLQNNGLAPPNNEYFPANNQ